MVLVLASCGTGAASNSNANPGVAPATAPVRPLTIRRVAVRHTVRAVRTLRPVVTTTTTTRPAINPDTGPPPPGSGLGRRIIYCNSCQMVWLVEADEYVTARYQVSGRRGTPRPGEYRVFRKLDMGRSKARPDLRLPWFVGFTWGSTTDIGFHGIPLEPDDRPIQSDAQLGTPRSAGCIRESQFMAKVLYDWAPMDTLVVVTA